MVDVRVFRFAPISTSVLRCGVASPSSVNIFSRSEPFDTLLIPRTLGIWHRSVRTSSVDFRAEGTREALFVIICTIVDSTIWTYPQTGFHLLSPGVPRGSSRHKLCHGVYARLLVRRGRFFYALDLICPVYGELLLLCYHEDDKNHEQQCDEKHHIRLAHQHDNIIL